MTTITNFDAVAGLQVGDLVTVEVRDTTLYATGESFVITGRLRRVYPRDRKDWGVHRLMVGPVVVGRAYGVELAVSPEVESIEIHEHAEGGVPA